MFVSTVLRSETKTPRAEGLTEKTRLSGLIPLDKSWQVAFGENEPWNPNPPYHVMVMFKPPMLLAKNIWRVNQILSITL